MRWPAVTHIEIIVDTDDEQLIGCAVGWARTFACYGVQITVSDGQPGA
jgi:hypothetical protein